MSILFAIPDMGSGGAERVISILAEQFCRVGYNPKILMFFGNRKHYLLPKDTECIELNLMSIPKLDRIKKVRQIIKSQKTSEHLSIFALHDSVLNYLLVASIGIRNVDIISAERNNPYIKGTSVWNRMKASLPYFLSHDTVFQTPDAREYYFLRERKCHIIPNPIRIPESRWLGHISPQKLISVCRLHEQKNLYMTLEVIQLLLPKYPDIHIDIYGEGSLHDEIQNAIHASNLDNNISLKGISNNVAKLLAEASIFVSTSDFEGISNSMLEAMSVGMPCLCTDCPIGGARMMLSDNCGELSPVGDAKTFAAKLDSMLTNPVKSRLLGENAILRVKQYAPDKIAKKWLDLITK